MANVKLKVRTDKADTDRISDLPSNVIGNILERLPLHEAVRTSILSTRWRMQWVSVSVLVFDDKFFDDVLGSRPCRVSTFERLVGKILLHHHSTIEKFSLSIPYMRALPDISPWFHYISRNGVKELCLCGCIINPKIKVPPYLFCCVDLVQLELTYCIFSLPSPFRGFKNLVCFKASLVTFSEGSLRMFINSCPLLEKLSLSRCDGVDFTSGSKLKSLRVSGEFESISVGYSRDLTAVHMNTGNSIGRFSQNMRHNVIKILTSLGKVETLHLGANIYKMLVADSLGELFAMTFNNMKNLSLCGVDFCEPFKYSLVLAFIKSCPYIQELRIQADTTVGTDIVEDISDSVWNSYKLFNFQKVHFLDMSGLRPELKLIKLLLASAPKLKVLHFSFKKEISGELKSRIFIKLMEFSRASPEAQLKYYEPTS